MTTEELNIAVAKLLGWKVEEGKNKNWVIIDPQGARIIMGEGYSEDGLWSLLYRMRLPRYTSNLNLAWPLLKGMPLALTFLSRMLEAEQGAEDVAYRICAFYVEVNAKKLLPLPVEYPYPDDGSLPNPAIIESSIGAED